MKGLGYIFDIEKYERKVGNKYKAIVIIGRYARYLMRKSERERKPLKEDPVIIAAEKFVEEGIPYKESEEGTAGSIR